jgi:hypothetical protein
MAKAASTSIICESHLHVQTDLAELRAAGVQPLFAFFCFLASLREDLRARALVDAAAAEHDDDWRELEAWHKAQRARRTGRSR